jgi:hypothetical protein
MSQPEKVTPSYLGPAGQQAPPSIYAVLKDQVMAPQYRDDNLRYVHLISQASHLVIEHAMMLL